MRPRESGFGESMAMADPVTYGRTVGELFWQSGVGNGVPKNVACCPVGVNFDQRLQRIGEILGIVAGSDEEGQV